jgi:phytoene desaturase
MDWRTQGPILREKALSRLASLIGRDPRPLIDAEIAISPDDWRNNHINHGATFNLAHGLDQMLHLRPQHELPFCKGVWLVGGGTHPGSGLPVIFLSSQITSKLLCAKLGLGDPTLPTLPTPPTTPPLAPQRARADQPDLVGSTI